MSVEDKVIVITGGASGIGLASARLLADRGAKITLADRNEEAGADAAADITLRGATAIAVPTNVADSKSVERLIERVLSGFGRIDVLLHCAGVCPRAGLLEMSDQDWRDVLAINLDGAFYTTRGVARVMAAQKSGTMILLTSDRGLYGSAEYAHYAASKGGMIALVKSLAIALGPHGVTVNGLNPGMTDTPLARGAITEEAWRAKEAHDVLGTHSRAEEIAEIVAFLAGTAGKFMTGQIVATRLRNFA
jgi:NAD(P)-dependent dehydrogenase (short-subunit alcohol dehydrogenase family)